MNMVAINGVVQDLSDRPRITHRQVITTFLSTRAAEFVKDVEREWTNYATYAVKHALDGCLRRDEVRARLTRLAYHRQQRGVATGGPILH